MQTDVRKHARELASKISWADIVGNIDNLKVEMLWRLYAQNVFGQNEVSAVQYKEMKQSYFCGFSECFRIMSDIADRYDENEANDILTRLCRESNEYIESLLDRTLR